MMNEKDPCQVFGCENPRDKKSWNLCAEHEREAAGFPDRSAFFESKKVRLIRTVCHGCGYKPSQGEIHTIRTPGCMNFAFGSTFDGLYNFKGAKVCPDCGVGWDSKEQPNCPNCSSEEERP